MRFTEDERDDQSGICDSCGAGIHYPEDEENAEIVQDLEHVIDTTSENEETTVMIQDKPDEKHPDQVINTTPEDSNGDANKSGFVGDEISHASRLLPWDKKFTFCHRGFDLLEDKTLILPT